jgi:hypothetical integral membrane protein (TIGR02206 family)
MDGADTFRPFSPAHVAVVALFVMCATILVPLGRRWRGTARGMVLDHALATGCLSTWIIINGWWLLPWNFNLGYSLPLHVCDITCLLAPLVLLWPARWMRAILYFWGIGLSLQGFIQPDLRDGPARLGFWFFWANHFVVVGIAIYDLARGYRPAWRDFAFAVAATVVYLGVVLPIDIIWEVNYGYVGPVKPLQPTLIDQLGPWPWRVFVLIGLAWTVMALMVLPWVFIPRSPRKGEGLA